MGFDEFLNKSYIDSMTNPYDAARDGFKAGAASRQYEIDNLKAELETLQGMHNAVSLEAGNLVEESDELQKRIELLEEVNESITDELVCYRSRYGKGSQNDNSNS